MKGTTLKLTTYSGHINFCLMLSRAASEFCKLSGLLCSYGLYQVVLSEQLCLYCRGNTSEFSARLVLVDQETGASEFVHVCTVVSRVSAHVCTSFQGVNVAASIQTYGSYIPGKCLEYYVGALPLIFQHVTAERL